jgi:hypothetical protein
MTWSEAKDQLEEWWASSATGRINSFGITTDWRLPGNKKAGKCPGRSWVLAVRCQQRAKAWEILYWRCCLTQVRRFNELDEVLNAIIKRVITDLQNTADGLQEIWDWSAGNSIICCRIVLRILRINQVLDYYIWWRFQVYSTVLFRLLELIIMDVIAGHVVYFDRNVKSMFYVDYKPASQEIISGKGIKRTWKFHW